MSVNYTDEEIKHAHEVLFNEGLKMRYQVAGKEYVDASLKNGKGPFASAMQEVSMLSQPLSDRLGLQRCLLSSSPSPAGDPSGRAPVSH